MDTILKANKRHRLLHTGLIIAIIVIAILGVAAGMSLRPARGEASSMNEPAALRQTLDPAAELMVAKANATGDRAALDALLKQIEAADSNPEHGMDNPEHVDRAEKSDRLDKLGPFIISLPADAN